MCINHFSQIKRNNTERKVKTQQMLVINIICFSIFGRHTVVGLATPASYSQLQSVLVGLAQLNVYMETPNPIFEHLYAASSKEPKDVVTGMDFTLLIVHKTGT